MEPRNILLPLDGSKDSEAALAVVGALARSGEDVVHLLYVVDVAQVARQSTSWISKLLDVDALADFDHPDEYTRRLEARGAEIMDEAERRLGRSGVRVTRTVEHGPPASFILGHGRDADVIALGRRGEGRHGPADGLGRNSKSVLRSFPAPILLAGPDGLDRIERPLFAYDGASPDHSALAPALDLARALHVPLTILHLASDRSAHDRAHVGRHLADRPAEIRWVDVESDARPRHQVILEAAGKWGHDLVILDAGALAVAPGAGESPVEIVAREMRAPVLILD